MFDINQKVVCVDDSFPSGVNDIYNSLPKKGKIYTVRDIIPAQGFDLKGTCGVLIKELENKPNKHGIEPCFLTHRFREIDDLETYEENVESESLVNH